MYRSNLTLGTGAVDVVEPSPDELLLYIIYGHQKKQTQNDN